MKTLLTCLALLVGMGAFPTPQAAPGHGQFGDFSFAPYGGIQINWPLAVNARVIQEHAVPIYLGLPQRRYIIAGRIFVPYGAGAAVVVNQGPAEDIFNEMGRQRDCARLARQLGGDAVLVTDHPAILKAFNLTKDEIERSAPLLANRDKLVLVIQFDAALAGNK